MSEEEIIINSFTLHAVSMQILAEDVHTLKSGIKAVQLEMNKEPDNFIIFISTKILNFNILTYWIEAFWFRCLGGILCITVFLQVLAKVFIKQM